MNKGKIYIVLTVLAMISIVVLEYTKPQELNWFPSYTKHHKIPFGTFVFHEQLERLFSKEHIIDIDRSPFLYLKQNDSIQGTYFFVNDNLAFDDAELDELLNWTAKGNTLFLASENIKGKLLDTLNIKPTTLSNFDNLNNNFQLQFKNKRINQDSLFNYDKANSIFYFKDIDTLQAKVIGVIDNASDDLFKLEEEHINTIKQPFGAGSIIISTFPQAFTNYFILTKPNQNYTAGLLSYIDATKPIYIDNHYKSGKKFHTSPLYILLNTKELKWAYYIMILGVFMYIIFDGKRKQRAIPIVKPIRNQTIDFTRTIANMYFEKGKHKELAHHKIQYFMDYIRTHFHLKTSNCDAVFIKQLAARSNNTIEDTAHLFKIIKDCDTKKQINTIELEKLNTLIEAFKPKTHKTGITKQ